MLQQVRRHPARALLVIVTLALGLGAATSIASAIRGVLLAPLPFPQPERLVAVQELEQPEDFGTTGFVTFDDWRRSLRSFESLAATAWRSYTLLGGEPEQLAILAVSHNAFETFGVRPILGREFVPADDVRGAHRVVVLSHELWSRRYGRDRAILGKTIRMSDIEFEVVGVMPPRTRLVPEEWRDTKVDAWLALRYDASLPYACRGCRHIRVYGRLRPGVTADQAAREVETFTATLRRRFKDDFSSRSYTAVRSLQEIIVGRQVASSLWIVLGVVVLVLFAAIANAASLRLSELFTRHNEVVVRQSLGATPFAIAKMLVAESVLQALAASVLGIAIAQGGIVWLRSHAGAFLPRAADLALDPWLVAGCTAMAVLAGIAIGVLPAVRARSWSLRTAGRGVVSTRSRAQKLLVGLNVALAVVLMSGSALLLRSVRNLFSTPSGLDATNVTSFRMSVGNRKYDDPKQLLALYERFLADSRQVAGVEGIALTTQLPFAENNDNASITPEERVAQQGDSPYAQRFAVTSDYFAALRIPIRRGRAFTREESEPVVILNETAARMLWPNGDALGKRLLVGGGDDNPFRRVIAIAADVAPGDLGAEPEAQAYVPLLDFAQSEVTGVVRMRGDATALRETMRRIEPDVAFYRIASLESLVRASEARRTFILACLSSFSALSLLLAMIGVYGVLSLLVTSRTRELGVRMALGSTSAGVFRHVLSYGLQIIVIALLAGLALSLLLGRALASLLYGVRSGDPATLASVTALLLVTSALACAVPAWRAARTSPVAALRDE